MRLQTHSWTFRITVFAAFLFLSIPVLADVLYALDEMSGETNVYLHVYAGVLTALVAFPAMLIQVMISSDPTHQITFKTALVIENIIYVLFGAALGAIIGLVVQALTFSTSTPHADSYGVLFEKS